MGNEINLIAVTPYICPTCNKVLAREIVSAKKELYKITDEVENIENVEESEEGYVTLTLLCKGCSGVFRFK